ncbi:hypothetical protein ACWD7M_16425 [Streptomyces griseus]
MRLQSLKAPELYAVRGIDHRTVPALVLDTVTWDLRPGNPPSFEPSPPDAQTPKVLDSATGARRGILTVLPSLDAPAQGKILVMLRQVQREAKRLDFPQDGKAAFPALREQFAELPLVFDAIRATRIISTWKKFSTEAPLLCPACGEPIKTDGSSRIRAHFTREGTPCNRNGTGFSLEERLEQTPRENAEKQDARNSKTEKKRARKKTRRALPVKSEAGKKRAGEKTHHALPVKSEAGNVKSASPEIQAEMLSSFRAAGLTPVGHIAEIPTRPTLAKCEECGYTVGISLQSVLDGKRCRHLEARKVAAEAEAAEAKAVAEAKKAKQETERAAAENQKAAAKAAAQAKAEELARKAPEIAMNAGYEPKEPFPGRSRPWSCTCLVCHQDRRPTFASIEAGGRCSHRTTAKAASL